MTHTTTPTTPPINRADTEYLDLVERILHEGRRKGDRTGTGTLSLFGERLKFNLRDGFPLLTTKKIFWRGVVEELLWFLRGSTNEHELREKKVHFWKEWATPEQCARFGREPGNLGPIYGWSWRRFGEPYPQKMTQRQPQLRVDLEATYLGVANGSGKEHHPLKKTWEGMIARCYDPQSPSYQYYGEKGVSVCDEWLEFRVFAAEAVLLPGYSEGSDRVLDKDGRVAGESYLYSRQTCQWVTPSKNTRLKFSRVFVLKKQGTTYRVPEGSVREFCEEHGVDSRNISDLWTGRKNAKTRYGFSLVSIEDSRNGVDQIREALNLLANSPESRRILVSGWNPAEATKVALPPCHTIFQFETHEEPFSHGGSSHMRRVLSCHMYQRSADIFLGVPFNIASYALLTHMFAHVLGYEVGDLIISFGDVHIYSNHIDQVNTQLEREPREAPHLIINADHAVPADELYNDPDHLLTNLLAIQFEHLTMANYKPHPKIAAKVAV